MLRERVFLKADFFERRDGNCRLMPSLTRALSATGPEWSERIAPYAEELATLLRETPARPLTDRVVDPLPAWVPRLIRTPLTGQNRTARRFRPTLGMRAPDLAVLPLARRCLACGIDMGVRERAYCDNCRAANQTRERRTVADAGTGSMPQDGRSRPEVRAIHRARTTQQMAAQRDWERANGGRPSAEVFVREIAPGLKSLPVRALVEATRLGEGFFKGVRAGRNLPQPMHWAALRALVALSARSSAERTPIDLTRIDEARWHREIMPPLPTLGASGIARATSLSLSYARRILRGHHIPKPSHWRSLLKTIEAARR